jgi:hypothetical protein
MGSDSIDSSVQPEEMDEEVIFRAYITTRNGKRIYPKGGKRAFRIVIRKPRR